MSANQQEKTFVTEGTVAFCNLDKTEFYNGSDTGKYSVTPSTIPRIMACP